jgi:hypothetical protein
VWEKVGQKLIVEKFWKNKGFIKSIDGAIPKVKEGFSKLICLADSSPNPNNDFYSNYQVNH